jgi:anti-sigma factor RsiW
MSHERCETCERLLQVYLDGELSDEKARETETHLDACGYCRQQYRFERLLRAKLKEAAREPISPELVSKLAALRESAR